MWEPAGMRGADRRRARRPGAVVLVLLVGTTAAALALALTLLYHRCARRNEVWGPAGMKGTDRRRTRRPGAVVLALLVGTTAAALALTLFYHLGKVTLRSDVPRGPSQDRSCARRSCVVIPALAELSRSAAAYISRSRPAVNTGPPPATAGYPGP